MPLQAVEEVQLTSQYTVGIGKACVEELALLGATVSAGVCVHSHRPERTSFGTAAPASISQLPNLHPTAHVWQPLPQQATSHFPGRLD